jgi:inhibitor of KinA sporulation pathway (predicted exonuclease)
MMTSLNLPNEFVSFDTEYTAWQGAQERRWSGPGEYREIVQIGAVLVRSSDLSEIGHFMCYVRPVKNPLLSEYFTLLTGITQKSVDTQGLAYDEALVRFLRWTRGLHLYCWGSDLEVMKENADLIGISFPFPMERQIDVRSVFQAHGIETKGYNSSSIPKAFGEVPPPNAHDALSDARSILQGLRALDRHQR